MICFDYLIMYLPPLTHNSVNGRELRLVIRKPTVFIINQTPRSLMMKPAQLFGPRSICLTTAADNRVSRRLDTNLNTASDIIQCWVAVGRVMFIM